MVTGRRFSRRGAATLLCMTLGFTGLSSAPAPADPKATPSSPYTSALAAFDAAWDANGLAFTAATFAETAGAAYGQYTPRADTEFRAGDVLFIYAEPVGYGFREAEGLYAYELTASYKLLNLTGQVLTQQDGFAVFAGKGRSRQRELAASLSFQFSGLREGTYQLETRFSDEVNGKTATFTLPFTITAPN